MQVFKLKGKSFLLRLLFYLTLFTLLCLLMKFQASSPKRLNIEYNYIHRPRTTLIQSLNEQAQQDETEFNQREADAAIGKLLDACHYGSDLLITRDTLLEGTRAVNAYINECHPIEIMERQAGRSMGHCGDFVQVIYHANARLVSIMNETIMEAHAKRCPNSIQLHLEYPTEFFLTLPKKRY